MVFHDLLEVHCEVGIQRIIVDPQMSQHRQHYYLLLWLVVIEVILVEWKKLVCDFQEFEVYILS